MNGAGISIPPGDYPELRADFLGSRYEFSLDTSEMTVTGRLGTVWFENEVWWFWTGETNGHLRDGG